MIESTPIRTSEFPPCQAAIRSLYPTLTNREKQIADYVLSHEDVIYRSITETVKLSGVGYGTIIRFCKRLGYDGFQDFKIHLARDAGPRENQGTGGSGGSGGSGSEQAILRSGHKAMEDIETTAKVLSADQLEKAAKALAAASFVLVAGVGASAVTAMDVEYRLVRLGINAVSVPDHHMQRTRAAVLEAGQVGFFVSFSGSTHDIIEGAKIAGNSGATLISLTNFPESPLSEIANFNLTSAVVVDPLSSEIVSKAAIHTVIDALMIRVFQLRENAQETLERTSRAGRDAQV